MTSRERKDKERLLKDGPFVVPEGWLGFQQVDRTRSEADHFQLKELLEQIRRREISSIVTFWVPTEGSQALRVTDVEWRVSKFRGPLEA